MNSCLNNNSRTKVFRAGSVADNRVWFTRSSKCSLCKEQNKNNDEYYDMADPNSICTDIENQLIEGDWNCTLHKYEFAIGLSATSLDDLTVNNTLSGQKIVDTNQSAFHKTTSLFRRSNSTGPLQAYASLPGFPVAFNSDSPLATKRIDESNAYVTSSLSVVDLATNTNNSNSKSTAMVTRGVGNEVVSNNLPLPQPSNIKASLQIIFHIYAWKILAIIASLVTLSTGATLVYFAIDPENDPHQPTPRINTSSFLNQTQNCGIILSQYLPEHVTNILIEPNSSFRIIGGKPASIKQYPWQAALFHDASGFLCGASIILTNWLLTATHCFSIDRTASSITAYMGLTYLNERNNPTTVTRRIIEIISHPNYDSTSFAYDYDISLLKLETDVVFTELVQPICLPPQNFVFPDGMQCYVSGWGVTSSMGSQPSNVLRHVEVEIINNRTCNEWLGELVTDRMLCAGLPNGTVDSCQGDSGGPLSCYDSNRGVYVVAGTVSWGFGCGLPKLPGVYAKVSFFTDWIWNEIGSNERLG